MKLRLKVYALINREVERQEQKYIAGLKNDYFEYDADAEEIFECLEEGGRLKAENAELRQTVRDLKDALYGRKIK